VGGAFPLATVVILIVKLPESAQYLIVHGASSERAATTMARVGPRLADVRRVGFVPGAATLKGFSVKHLFTEGRV